MVGHPVTLTLNATQPPGTTLRWHLIDKKLAADTAIVILQVATYQMPNATVRHEVVFTRAQGGPYDSGSLCALRVGRSAALDSLSVPGVKVRFQPEAPRSDLHSLRPIVSWRQSGLLSEAGLLVLATFLLGTGRAYWLTFRQARGQATRTMQFQAPTRQQTLFAMEELERNIDADSQGSPSTPEQLYRILTAYLAWGKPIDDGPASSADSYSPGLLVDEAPLAGRVDFNGLLNELSSVRFAPNQLGANVLPHLLARARELVRADETGALPEKH